MHRWDQDGRKLNKYWSKQTGISLKQFYKSYKDKRTKDQPTKNKEYKGICSIQYFDTNIQFELQAIGESLLIA
jgi:abortive infection bacteriophage resistance protein